MTFKPYLSIVVLIGSFLAGGMTLFVPAPAVAQSVRTLPDFTDLVEQVGPR